MGNLVKKLIDFVKRMKKYKTKIIIYRIRPINSTSEVQYYMIRLINSTSEVQYYRIRPTNSTAEVQYYMIRPTNSTSEVQYNTTYRCPKSKVDLVSTSLYEAGEQHITIVVLALPPKLS